ncbi:MAG: UDP-glucose 4-epimerase GalE [Jatrophihabitantaceae bacterium]
MHNSASGQCWLVSGGAGYIGAHVVCSLQAAGAHPIVLDDLSTGVRDRVEVPFVAGDIGDVDLVVATLRSHRVAGVVHLAADKQVEESVRQPLRYYRRNVLNLMQLLTAMRLAEVDRLVFSSSAAVYGMVDSDRVGEDDRTEPINPYGQTKLIGEWLIRDQARASGLRYAALRYFNVVGAGAPELGDLGGANLVPMIFEAVRRGEQPRIFGSDYPTPDGTCVRDYVHVADLAGAHVAAIAALDSPDAELVVNVGRGHGYSVREVIDMVAEVIGIELDPVLADRRPGDPASVVADTSRIAEELGWRAQHDLADMVRSAWQAEQWRARQVPGEQAAAELAPAAR